MVSLDSGIVFLMRTWLTIVPAGNGLQVAAQMQPHIFVYSIPLHRGKNLIQTEFLFDVLSPN